MKQKVTFIGPGRVVTRAIVELVIPDIAAARCEDGVFGVRIAKVFTEGLGCDAGRDEIDLIVVVSDRNLMLSLFVQRIFHICFPKVSRQRIELKRTCIFQVYKEKVF